jgi:teichuronic acid exporter
MSNAKYSKQSVISSVVWKFLKSGSAQTAQFVTQIFLARLLLPHDYGLLVIVVSFTVFCSIFIVGGFSAFLIQKKDVDDTDSVLY